MNQNRFVHIDSTLFLLASSPCSPESFFLPLSVCLLTLKEAAVLEGPWGTLNNKDYAAPLQPSTVLISGNAPSRFRAWRFFFPLLLFFCFLKLLSLRFSSEDVSGVGYSCWCSEQNSHCDSRWGLRVFDNGDAVSTNTLAQHKYTKATHGCVDFVDLKALHVFVFWNFFLNTTGYR